jgi:hypothetical protein
MAAQRGIDPFSDPRPGWDLLQETQKNGSGVSR